MTLGAEERDVQGLVVVPVMTFQAEPLPTPRAALRSRDQPELFPERRGIAGRARPDAARAEGVEADFEMTAEPGELGVLTVQSAFFHGSTPVLERVAGPLGKRRVDGGFHSLGGAPRTGTSGSLPTQFSQYKCTARP